MVISKAMSEAFSSATSMPMAKNIKNAPYSAEVISEKVQTLPDGNQITRKTSTLSYRDSAGRTRQETRDAKGDVKSVQIHDAVEGSRYVISPSKKTATKLGIDKDLQKRIEEIKEKAKAMAKDGKAHVIERSSGPGEEIIVKRFESPASDGKKEIHEEVKVNVVRASGPGGANAGAYAFKFGEGESMGRALGELTRTSPIGTSFQDLKWSAKSTTTSLGTKEIEGVRVEGKNVSYTIPAGEIGNKNPILVSTETWYSPETTGDGVFKAQRSAQRRFYLPALRHQARRAGGYVVHGAGRLFGKRHAVDQPAHNEVAASIQLFLSVESFGAPLAVRRFLLPTQDYSEADSRRRAIAPFPRQLALAGIPDLPEGAEFFLPCQPFAGQRLHEIRQAPRHHHGINPQRYRRHKDEEEDHCLSPASATYRG